MAETILNQDQQKVLDLFREDKNLSSLFYLTGGTALAEFYLKHRKSDDLDFFIGEEDFPFTIVENFIKTLSSRTGWEARHQKLYDRHMFFLQTGNTTGGVRGEAQELQELKVEFTLYPFPNLENRVNHDGLQVDSLRDIAANKLMALIDRFEPKDFADLYFLLWGEFKLEELVQAVNKKFGFKAEPMTLGSELMKVKRITFLPAMKKELTIQKLQGFFVKLAEDFRPRIIE